MTRFCAIVVLAVGTVGCGEEQTPTFPVQGQVVFEDGSTLPFGGRVRFYCDAASPPIMAQGRIDNDGNVSEMTTFRKGDGAVAGEHKAIVVPEIPDDKGSMSEKEFQAASNPMHRRFKGTESSGLRFTVKPDGENRFKFEIQRPRRR